MPERHERLTDDEYAELAADYEANPPTPDEIIAIESNPAFQRSAEMSRAVEAGEYTVSGPIERGTTLHMGRPADGPQDEAEG